MIPAYTTGLGQCFEARAEDLLSSSVGETLKGKVDLIFTSPPFPLNRKKKYGNKEGQEYVAWLAGMAPKFQALLKPTGSIVIELGNAWEPGRPVMSTLGLEALLAFKIAGNLNLCQQFVWNNTARLPSPIQWVNVKRWRVKDAFTHLWWLSPTDTPEANNRRVLTPYSASMKDLLRTGKYNSGKRPSEYTIGKDSFNRDNQGAIPSNVISLPNTQAGTDYLRYCERHHLPKHPARMPTKLAEFFIRFLTKENNLVMDPFAGSNTTGAAAENLGRRWIAVEPEHDYVMGSRGRFELCLSEDSQESENVE